MTDPNSARFSFKSKLLDVAFEGSPDFVTAQIHHMSAAFVRSVEAADAAAAATSAPASAAARTAAAQGGSADAPAVPAAPAAASAAAAAPAAPTIEEFYKRAKSRQGRGALQETVLIFAYFLRQHRAQEEFGIDHLNACFSLVGVTPPRSLANTLGIMKRTQRFFHSGSRRGHYTLTDKGMAYVRRLVGA